uniref:Guanine nucleotide exchange factor MSS4 n=1 Tax=Elaeophora elaphi TaxID=1147741 RepID=A0A0R3RZB8_9BILA
MTPVKEVTQNLFTENVPATNEKCGGKNEKQDFSVLVDDQQRNKKEILCRRCQCVVFGAKRVILLQGKDAKELKEMSVGGMEGKQVERTDIWWYTTNEYAFDTIGFLTVDDLDVLMCGDCEFGPIGWRTSDNKNFWVAAERMNYA